MAKKSKYDTDPLDPEVEGRATQQWTQPIGPVPETAQSSSGSSDRRPYAGDDYETRRFEQKGYTAYQSVYEQPSAPAPVPLGQKNIQPPTSRIVPGLNLAENLTLILPYIPFYIGAIAGLIELFLIPRDETRARFHASQGLALHIVALAIGAVLGALSSFSGARIGGIAVSITATILFVVSMIRVWKGEPHHLAPLDDLSSWLNEKIAPKK